MSEVIHSGRNPRLDWSQARLLSAEYGPKGASCLALPKPWIPPFALIPASIGTCLADGSALSDQLDGADLHSILSIAEDRKPLIVRSSVIGESIWERGTYKSVLVDPGDSATLAQRLDRAAAEVAASAEGKAIALMIQRYIEPVYRGELGNLQRISKTRDQWELSQSDRAGATSRSRLNSQRDTAADPTAPIPVRAGVGPERVFGSVAAWMNNELLRGKSERLNCEWVTDSRHIYLVQIDGEDEDVWGVNPLQIRVLPSIRPQDSCGRYLQQATGDALAKWDKLKVLEELWEPEAVRRPVLFYLALEDLPPPSDEEGVVALAQDFRDLIGPAGIVVRTSVAAGAEKAFNLPRTECLDPERAAQWCLSTASKLHERGGSPLAFVAHHFVASRASAWVRADPSNPMVEIHALWGLPDALQYCPYDIWEVHVPTGVATDYPEYKSDMLISRPDGGWEYARVKNEMARANCISVREARDVAARSAAIARQMGRACHIMWFIGCIDPDGSSYNMPWYWTEAHEAGANIDRIAYNILTVTDDESLRDFCDWAGSRHRQALALRPTDLRLMRDNSFIERVGAAAARAGVPVILAGSTLAHAYYQLRKQGCVVLATGQKEHSRIRRSANLGKLVRDKIPDRIAKRQEHEVTKKVPTKLMKGFLLGKLLEEALEVREASSPQEKQEELADLYEVVRALAKAEGLDLQEIVAMADKKREKAGGFEEGLVLLQTGIAPSDRTGAIEVMGQLLADQTAEDAIELPFSFFGFMEFDQPRSLLLERFGVRLDVCLHADRIEIRIVRSSEQLGLPLHDETPAGIE